jgi:hypothetical protein
MSNPAISLTGSSSSTSFSFLFLSPIFLTPCWSYLFAIPHRVLHSAAASARRRPPPLHLCGATLYSCICAPPPTTGSSLHPKSHRLVLAVLALVPAPRRRLASPPSTLLEPDTALSYRLSFSCSIRARPGASGLPLLLLLTAMLMHGVCGVLPRGVAAAGGMPGCYRRHGALSLLGFSGPGGGRR